jgi:DtxR family transcriptional regulator, Mn-dependent transcriptional regulator
MIMAETHALTPTVEDYLMVVYVMQREGKEVIAARMAEWMNVSPPTVSLTIKRMVRDRWLVLDERQRLVLTPQGHDAAAAVLRRHMLSEHLLSRVLGVPWSAIHSEAGLMEHSLSVMTTERMATILDDPLTCPHGNPLPGNEAMLDDLTPLTELQAGQSATIIRIDEEGEQNRDFLHYLERHGLMPGSSVSVQEVMSFNQTMTVLSGGQSMVFGLSAARHVHVRPG